MAWERFRRGKPRERCRRRSPRRTRLEQVGATGSDPAVKPPKSSKDIRLLGPTQRMPPGER
jgi:hypothetical protein